MTEKPQATSHVEALKSTSIIGGSTAIVMLIRMVRTKVLAILLGPAGIGLEAVFDSIVNLVRALFDFGISGSGVRQIAVAAGTRNEEVVAVTVFTLRRTCLVLGTLGAAVLFLGRAPISRLAFGNTDHASALGWLALMVFFAAISAGQSVLLQGMRRIADMAKMNILGTLAGATLSIPIVYFWGQAGIPAYMVLGAGVALLVSWLYARRIRIKVVTVSTSDVVREATGLLKLGLAFMSSGLISTGATFLLRTLVTREAGVDGAGQFQAASSLSMVYVGFILQAMGTDFYPRLTEVAENNARCNQVVNEQAEISLLLALPGIFATLALAPWVIHLFYSGKFALSSNILAWQVTGMLFRVGSWPMGFIVMAKGRGATVIWTDFAAYSVYVLLGWLGLKWFGLAGTGMAFLGLYLFHWCMMYAVVRQMSGFRWSAHNVQLLSFGALAVIVTLWARLNLPEPWATLTGGALAVLSGLYSLRALMRLIGTERITRYLGKLGLSFLLPKKSGG